MIFCQPVSRVLSSPVIYLVHGSHRDSSSLPSLKYRPKTIAGTSSSTIQGLFGLSTRKVCRALLVAKQAVSSYLTVSPFPDAKNRTG